MSDALLNRDGTIARITLNRPTARNGMTFEMVDTMVSILEELAGDDSIQVVLIEGAGMDFCVGVDLAILATRNAQDVPSDRPSQEQVLNPYRIPVLLHEMPQITLAAVRGACAGAGFAIACACDVRVCDETALFRTAFAGVGVAGDMSGAWTLPRIVGSARAIVLFLLNDRIDAAQAAALGLVSHVFGSASFDADVAELAARIAGSSPLALRAMKANFRDAEALPLDAYSLVETQRHHELLATEDVREAAVAFLEKRPPRFHGR